MIFTYLIRGIFIFYQLVQFKNFIYNFLFIIHTFLSLIFFNLLIKSFSHDLLLLSSALVVTPEEVVAVIPAVVVVVTPAVAVAVADHRRLMVLPVEVADRATPAMEDTNTNPDMCSPGETISVLNHVGFHQVFCVEQRKPNLSQPQDSLVRSINLIDYVLSEKRRRSERLVLIER